MSKHVAAEPVEGSSTTRWTRIVGIAVLTLSMLIAGLLPNLSRAYADAPVAPVALGAAETYSVLGGTTVGNTDTPPDKTTLSGDLGVSPGCTITGFPAGSVGGSTNGCNAAAVQAQTNLSTAYFDAKGRNPTVPVTAGAAVLDGQVFTTGVYGFGAAVTLNTTMTLDAQNNPNAVFIFQVTGALSTAATSHIVLANGAKASNVFWQVEGAVALGAQPSTFIGTIMGFAAIAIGAGTGLTGRALSLNGAVTLSSNTVVTAMPLTITGGPARLTKNSTPTISGIAEAPNGTTVTVTVGGQTLTTTVQNGAWSVTAATLTDGPKTVLASMTYPIGTTNTATQTLTIDTVAPLIAITGGATATSKTAKPTIAGTTNAGDGQTVTITIAGQTLTTTAQSGAWSVTATTAITDGQHTVVATVNDPAGNPGTINQTLTIDTSIALVPLGAAASYSVLSGASVGNTVSGPGAPHTILSGDLGVSSGGAITGFPPGVVNGTTHQNDVHAGQAQADTLIAYNDAKGRNNTALADGDLIGQTLNSGVYYSAGALSVSGGTLTLDGQNNPNAVFIFQVNAALNIAASTTIKLINGAKASNIFWQVNGAAAIGASSAFSGTVMSVGAIAIGAGTVFDGRALARDGAVALDANVVTTAMPLTITGGPARLTKNSTPTISGIAEAPNGTTVTVTVGGQTLTTTVQNGAWSVTAATLTDGPKTVLASMTYPIGTTNTATQTLTIDTVAPLIAITGGATATSKTAKPTIAGTTNAGDGQTVTITIAGQTLTTTAQSGAWSVTATTAITDGQHTVVATVNDPAGNPGTINQTLTIDTSIALVPLGAAGTFSVLGGTGVTNGAYATVTHLSGDLGLSPSGLISGFSPDLVGGTIYDKVPVAAQAQTALQLAYNDAAGRTATGAFAGDQNGKTFTPGVYHTDVAFTLTGTLTLDGQNNPNAVFIFQVNAALNTAAASTITLINGAQASHIFWQATGAVGTGANSSFTGTILTLGASTIGAGGSLNGRVLSQGVVTLAGNTIATPPAAVGSLRISVPTGTVDLGTQANTVPGEIFSGPLGQVQVNDTRNGTTGWVASVISTAFTKSGGQTIAASAISYSINRTITKAGTASYTANNPNNLTSPSPAVTAKGIYGDNSASWNPTISLAAPGGTVVGTYTATITHSVL